jgi:hypothetical protein
VHDATVAGIKTRVHAVSTSAPTYTPVLFGEDSWRPARTMPARTPIPTPLPSNVRSGSTSTVDANGVGHARASPPWHIDAGDADSVVIHALPTDPVMGAAGARLACTTVPFGVD